MGQRVSFDFDGTLNNPRVQKFAKDLLDLGYDVWICTARYDDSHTGLGGWTREHNNDLYEVAANLGISRNKIVFTNMELKGEFFKKNSDFKFHLDDDFVELMDVKKHSKVPAIDVKKDGWKSKCIDILGI